MLSRQDFLQVAAAAVGLSLTGCATPVARSPDERRSMAELPPHPRMADLLLSAIALVGVPYRLGGNDIDNGFDCSGFTRYLFQTHLDVTLPRRAQEQAQAAGFADVAPYDWHSGDLVFFNTLARRNSHVGIYVGDGRFIHAPRSGAQVRMEAIGARYWLARYDGARRLVMA